MEHVRAIKSNLVFLIGFLLFGVAFDFVFVGILKIAWLIIYGLTYLSVAMTIETIVARRRNKQLAVYALLAYLLGCLLGHVGFSNHIHHESYSMKVMSVQPMIVIKAAEFPESLYLKSDGLSQVLNENSTGQDVPMEVKVVTEYACVKKFIIETVDHVDIVSDPQSNWTFRVTPLGVFQRDELPTMYDHEWPWCKIEFYRTGS